MISFQYFCILFAFKKDDLFAHFDKRDLSKRERASLTEHCALDNELLICWWLLKITFCAGIMAILFCGIVMSHYTHLNLSPVTQITVQQTFRTIAFICGIYHCFYLWYLLFFAVVFTVVF